MITLEDLSTGYGCHCVASHLNASLASGRLTCLLGANGVGKSTLLRTLCGFLPPMGGSIRINGTDIRQLSRKEMSRTIGVVLTERPDVPDMNVEEMTAMGRTPYTGFWGSLQGKDREAVKEALQMVGITHLSERKVHTLSDGERQKVMIAKALAQQTPVILLDEPTAFLDLPNRYELCTLLGRLAHDEHKCIIFSTHELDIALSLADTIALVDTPALKHLPTTEMISSGNIERLFDSEYVSFDAATQSIKLCK